MTKLTKTITQLSRKGNNESSLHITVEYDPKEKTAGRILKVETYSWMKGIFTDITAIMLEQFEGQLNDMVDSIDWPEEYSNNQICAA